MNLKKLTLCKFPLPPAEILTIANLLNLEDPQRTFKDIQHLMPIISPVLVNNDILNVVFAFH
ncbi:hypothetical protein RND71_008710 [Anisodus tanguticus]|uniref:Uncharacterized protein n=1 Tax=Anisodus tanguticus TaxID=243964 RepID=A0AAE1SRE6_9SOLA|nr:hypothetical protein RND71_008710 [Anisodus tanguticus]